MIWYRTINHRCMHMMYAHVCVLTFAMLYSFSENEMSEISMVCLDVRNWIAFIYNRNLSHRWRGDHIFFLHIKMLIKKHIKRTTEVVCLFFNFVLCDRDTWNFKDFKEHLYYFPVAILFTLIGCVLTYTWWINMVQRWWNFLYHFPKTLLSFPSQW